MSYTPKPGDGSLFKNERATTDKHPTLKGSLLCPCCDTKLTLAAWKRAGTNGKPPGDNILDGPALE